MHTCAFSRQPTYLGIQIQKCYTRKVDVKGARKSHDEKQKMRKGTGFFLLGDLPSSEEDEDEDKPLPPAKKAALAKGAAKPKKKANIRDDDGVKRKKKAGLGGGRLLATAYICSHPGMYSHIVLLTIFNLSCARLQHGWGMKPR